jgi:hypothetical protein
MGEPFVTRFLPAEIAQLLHQHGFGELSDFGPEQAYAAYFQGRTDIDIAGAQRLIAATVMHRKSARPARVSAHGSDRSGPRTPGTRLHIPMRDWRDRHRGHH